VANLRLQAIASLPHFSVFLREASGDTDRAARLALLLLLAPDSAFDELPPPLKKEISRLRDPATLPSTLSAEVCRLQFLLSTMADGTARPKT
jgi:hypothetical protein